MSRHLHSRPEPRKSGAGAQLHRDTAGLTRHLRRTFGQKKIYLVGFSWGSLVGALTVSRHPEYFRDYIGISQLVDIPESELLLHRARRAETKTGRRR